MADAGVDSEVDMGLVVRADVEEDVGVGAGVMEGMAEMEEMAEDTVEVEQ